MSDRQETWAPGAVVADRFEIRVRIGAGAMGEVYEAVDRQSDGARVALKTLLSPDSGELHVRFRREAEMLAAVVHPNTVGIIAYGQEVVTAIPWIAMEFVVGETLEDRLLRYGALPWREAVILTLQVLDGLAAVHAVGLLHRDVKPANIAVEKGSGIVKLLDFGIARPEGEKSKLTRTGAAIGTPAYMAPEHLLGRAVAASDRYAAMLVLYELLAGDIPFADRGEAALVARLTGEPLPPFPADGTDPIPAPLLPLLQRSLAARVDDRPTATALAEALETVLRGGDPFAKEPVSSAPSVPSGAVVSVVPSTLRSQAYAETALAPPSVPAASVPSPSVPVEGSPPTSAPTRWLVVLRVPSVTVADATEREFLRVALGGSGVAYAYGTNFFFVVLASEQAARDFRAATVARYGVSIEGLAVPAPAGFSLSAAALLGTRPLPEPLPALMARLAG